MDMIRNIMRMITIDSMKMIMKMTMKITMRLTMKLTMRNIIMEINKMTIKMIDIKRSMKN